MAAMGRRNVAGLAWLAGFGGIAATLCDANHVATGTLRYPQPALFGQAWWVLPGFFVAFLGMGAAYLVAAFTGARGDLDAAEHGAGHRRCAHRGHDVVRARLPDERLRQRVASVAVARVLRLVCAPLGLHLRTSLATRGGGSARDRRNDVRGLAGGAGARRLPARRRLSRPALARGCVHARRVCPSRGHASLRVPTTSSAIVSRQ